MSTHLNEEKIESPADLNLFVEDLLEQMQSRFADMGNSILGRMDDMGTRMDELEQSIASLLQHAGLDENGYSINSSINSKSSLPIQTVPVYQRSPVSVQQTIKTSGIVNKPNSPVPILSSNSGTFTTTTSNAIESNMQNSTSTTVTTPSQNGADKSTRTRVTIEI